MLVTFNFKNYSYIDFYKFPMKPENKKITPCLRIHLFRMMNAYPIILKVEVQRI